MNCEEARKEFSALLDGELTPPDRERVEAHLSECADCLRELDSFKRLDLFYRALPEQAAPHGFEERVRKALRPGVIHLAKARLRRKPVWPLLLAAAMFTVLLGGVLYRLGPEPKSMQLASAPAPVEKAYPAQGEKGAAKMQMADAKTKGAAVSQPRESQTAETEPLAPEAALMAEASPAAGPEAKAAEFEMRAERQAEPPEAAATSFFDSSPNADKGLAAEGSVSSAAPNAAPVAQTVTEARPAPAPPSVTGRPSAPGQALPSPPRVEPPSEAVLLPAPTVPPPPAAAAPTPPPMPAEPPTETGALSEGDAFAGEGKASREGLEALDAAETMPKPDADAPKRREKQGGAVATEKSVAGTAGATEENADDKNGLSTQTAGDSVSLELTERGAGEERLSSTTATLGSRLAVGSDTSRERRSAERMEAPRLIDRTLDSWNREEEEAAAEPSAPPAAAKPSLGAEFETKKEEPTVGSRARAGKREFVLREDGWYEEGYAGETCREFARDSREAAALIKANPELSELLEYGKPVIFRVQTAWYRILPPPAAP